MKKQKETLEVPISYAAFLILLCLQRPSHGYEIMKYVEKVTKGIVTIGPATMYRSISDFLANDYIQLVSSEGTKKQYQLTEKGIILLEDQKKFLDLLHSISKERSESDERV